MKVSIRINHNNIATIIIESGNMTVSEDISVYKNRKYFADPEIIQQLLDAAFELIRSNGVGDFDTILNLYYTLLDGSEQEEFRNTIQPRLVDDNTSNEIT